MVNCERQLNKVRPDLLITHCSTFVDEGLKVAIFTVFHDNVNFGTTYKWIIVFYNLRTIKRAQDGNFLHGLKSMLLRHLICKQLFNDVVHSFINLSYIFDFINFPKCSFTECLDYFKLIPFTSFLCLKANFFWGLRFQ